MQAEAKQHRTHEIESEYYSQTLHSNSHNRVIVRMHERRARLEVYENAALMPIPTHSHVAILIPIFIPIATHLA